MLDARPDDAQRQRKRRVSARYWPQFPTSAHGLILSVTALTPGLLNTNFIGHWCSCSYNWPARNGYGPWPNFGAEKHQPQSNRIYPSPRARQQRRQDRGWPQGRNPHTQCARCRSKANTTECQCEDQLKFSPFCVWYARGMVGMLVGRWWCHFALKEKTSPWMR